jgi:autotransporter family porin
MQFGAGSGRIMDVDVDTCALDCCARNIEKERYSPAVTCHELPDGSGRFYRFRWRLLSNVTVKRRKSLLLAASALASSSLGISGPALAVDECGPLVGGSVTCTSANNPYPTGITYSATAGLPLNVTLDSNVNVVRTGPGIGVALDNFNSVGSPVLLSANGATINATQTLADQGNRGLYVETVSADATITASGQIDVLGNQGDHAIKAFVNTIGNASVTYNGPGLSSTGANSTDIQAQSANGNATIVASGNMSGHVLTGPTSNNTFVGLFANAGGNGNASVTYSSGTIDVQGRFANGIFAGADGNGTAKVTTLPGTTIIVSGTLPGESTPTQSLTAGITAELGGAAALGSAITVNAASTINMFGTVTPNSSIFGNPVGIRAISRADAPITVNYTGPGITTEGGGGIGILALANNGGGSGINSGGVTVASSGPITTNGAEALGIVADSGTIYNVTHSRPQLGPGGNVTVTSSGAITTQGAEAHGIWAASTTGTVLVNAFNNISTTGQFSTGINAISTGVPATGTPGSNVAVNVAQGVSVMGGWQAGVTGVGSSTLFALPAAGVILSSTGGTATLTNFGSIGALSDRAIAGDPQVTNNGLITGFVQFTGGNNTILNNGTFDLRHFADTNGDGVRDTLRVAIADLGDGPNNSFTNNGTLRLPAVTGATTLDSTGQYLPLGNPNNAMALGGPLQGHLIGVSTFTNSGTIDLQSNPVAGDVLVITGSRQAGVPGTGTFIANGGTLRLDTVLNQGDVATRSDTLVVDGTSVGAGGATNMIVRNAGGAGALTVKNGILVVQALDPSHSAPGVFKLGASPLTAGPFEYTLFHGGVDADAANGNWYLRSTLNCTLTPTLPECLTPGPTPPSPTIPNFRAETSLYAAIPSMALLYGRNLLDTLHERVGEEFDERGTPAAAPGGYNAYNAYNKALPLNAASQYLGWGRVIGMNGVQQGDTLGVLGSGTGGPHFDYSFLGIEAGMDVYRQDRADGSRDHAGAYFAVGGNHGRVTHFDGQQGDSDFAAYSLGGYWTHFGPTGWYTDAILQGTFYDINSSANRGLPALKTAGQGIAASIQGGYLFRLAGGYIIEPQGQLVYQNININDASDIAAQIRFADVDSLLGRIGARFGRTWAIDDYGQRTITAWIRPNLWNEFRGNPATSFSSQTGFIPFFADLGGLWGEVNVGVSSQFNANTTLYANASYQSRFDGGGFAYTGKAGLRVNW